MTFCNTCISVITEDIYLKLVCVYTIQRVIHTLKTDHSKCLFFSELCPFFDFDILSSIKHPTAERWPPHAVLLFYSKRFSTGRNSNFYYYFIQLLSKFHETSRLCCLLKVSSRDFFFIYVFLQFDALSWENGVSCKIPIFTSISFSFSQNFMILHSYIVYLKF